MPQYQIFVTYRCDLHCRYCYQMFDLLPCDDASSDMTEQDVIEAGRILADHKVLIGKIRFSGGEPLLHPRMKQLFDLTVEHWHPRKYVKTYSSGKVKNAKYDGLHAAVAGQGKKNRCHAPFMVSPVDVGLKTVQGVDTICPLARGCGRGFDTYGFMPCPRAWSLGRLFGFDSHSAEPVGLGTEQMCEHCIHSVSIPDFDRIMNAAESGEIEYPSKTFKAAIELRKKDGFVSTQKFIDRIKK